MAAAALMCVGVSAACACEYDPMVRGPRAVGEPKAELPRHLAVLLASVKHLCSRQPTDRPTDQPTDRPNIQNKSNKPNQKKKKK